MSLVHQEGMSELDSDVNDRRKMAVKVKPISKRGGTIMKFDAFVKVTLVLIAVFLGIIAFRPFFEIGSASANPGGKFDYVQFSVAGKGLWFFDSKTGKIYGYDLQRNGELVGRLVELGEPLRYQ